MKEYESERYDKQRYRRYRRDYQRIDPERFIPDEYALLDLCIFRADSAYEQSVRVDTVWSTGHQRAVVFSADELQVIGLGREDDAYPVDLVSKQSVEYRYRELVAYLEFVEVGEELGTRKSAMSREDAVCGVSADGKAGAFKVSDADLQDFFLGAVVNRQLDAYLVDVDVAHYPRASDVERVGVAVHIRRNKEGIGRGAEPVIVV